jgi:site-specific recombinase XerD
MKKEHPLIPLFKQFIRETETGKRLKKNGEKIKPESIDNYRYLLQNLIEFSTQQNFELRICEANKLNKKELISERNYWKKFYLKFTDFFYKKGCHDNYVGANMKIFRVFFNYLKNDKDFATGDFQRLFYVRKEEIDILVLSPDQLKFLIHNSEFDETLTVAQRKIKDIFVFGCTTGLRYSDIYLLTNKNIEEQQGEWYLKIKSKKTKTYSTIKLPGYAVVILNKYKSKSSKVPIFGKITLLNFNKNLKEISEIEDKSEETVLNNEKCMVDYLKKIENDNVTIHNQNVSYFKNMLKGKILAVVTIILFYSLSFTVREVRFGNSNYEALHMFLILSSALCTIASTHYLIKSIGSIDYISKFKKPK